MYVTRRMPPGNSGAYEYSREKKKKKSRLDALLERLVRDTHRGGQGGGGGGGESHARQKDWALLTKKNTRSIGAWKLARHSNSHASLSA